MWFPGGKLGARDQLNGAWVLLITEGLETARSAKKRSTECKANGAVRWNWNRRRGQAKQVL